MDWASFLVGVCKIQSISLPFSEVTQILVSWSFSSIFKLDKIINSLTILLSHDLCTPAYHCPLEVLCFLLSSFAAAWITSLNNTAAGLLLVNCLTSCLPEDIFIFPKFWGLFLLGIDFETIFFYFSTLIPMFHFLKLSHCLWKNQLSLLLLILWIWFFFSLSSFDFIFFSINFISLTIIYQDLLSM